jgi:hypothetical protein
MDPKLKREMVRACMGPIPKLSDVDNDVDNYIDDDIYGRIISNFKKEVQEEADKVSDIPFRDLPLYINAENVLFRTMVLWRLRSE